MSPFASGRYTIVAKAALDRLVEEHLPAALRFAQRLTGDLDAAEDLVQDALLRVARNWSGFRGEAKFRTWLFQIVVNVTFPGSQEGEPAGDQLYLVIEVTVQEEPDPGESTEIRSPRRRSR